MIPTDVLHVISEYLIEPPYKLSDGVTWSLGLLKNPYAFDLIEDYLSRHPITINEASILVCNKNPRALSYINLEEFPSLIRVVCRHHSPLAIDMIQHYPEESLDWSALSANPYAINLLRAHPHKIDWEALALNPEAYELIVEGLAEKRVNYWGCLYLLEGIHSERLMKESSHLFQESVLHSKRFERNCITVTQMCSRPDQIENVKLLDPSSWSIYGLAENTHPDAADLIERWLENNHGDEDVVAALCGSRNERVLRMVEERYPEFVDGSELSLNPQAIDMLLRNREWVRWDSLANNPSNRVMEVVKKYIHSFNASTFRVGMYKRLEILEVDKEKYQKRIKSLVKKLL